MAKKQKKGFVAMDTAKLNALIDSIASRGKRLDNDIHRAGINCIYHIDQHGDITLAEKLIESMPKSSRKKALVLWFMDNSKLSYNEEEKKYVYDKSKKTSLERAIEKPFWDHSQEVKPISPVDLDKRLESLIKQAEKALEDEQAKAKSNVDLDKLQKLKELIA